MMLFEELPYQRHSDTSREAAFSMRPHAENLRDRVYSFIKSSPVGATAQEIGAGLNLSGDSVRPRIVELVKRELIHVCGKRPTASNRPADVWVAR